MEDKDDEDKEFPGAGKVCEFYEEEEDNDYDSYDNDIDSDY